MRSTLRRRLFSFSCCLVVGLIVACSGNRARFAASGTIDATGGTLTVTTGPLTGTELRVPPGAVSSPVDVVIAGTLALPVPVPGEDPQPGREVPGFDRVGPGANISPSGLGLDAMGSATLVFDTDLAMGFVAADFVVFVQSSQGRRTTLEPTAVDMMAGTVTIDVEQFANYWVAVRTRARDLLLAAYLPLLDGDTYTFDNGFAAGVRDSFTEPNLEGILLSRLGFTRDNSEFGLYLRREFTETLLLGSFFFAESVQEVIFPPLTVLSSTGTLGSVFGGASFSTLYQPFGSTLPAAFLDVELSVTVESGGRLTTPLGTFTDVLEVLIETERETEDGEMETLEDTLWLARGVGPVGIELDGILDGRGFLTSGFVGGAPVIAR